MKNSVITFIISIAVLFSLELNAQQQVESGPQNIEEFMTQALEAKDEVWVVDFWASWCKPCIYTIPVIRNASMKYEDRGVRVISVSWDRNEVPWKAAIDSYEMDWDHVLVPMEKRNDPFWKKHFPHQSIPTVFIVSKEGKVKKVNLHSGSPEQALDKAIQKQLAK